MVYKCVGVFAQHVLGMEKMKKILNLEYVAIHGTFWMYYGVLAAFASVFLLGRDYSNTNIGVILAAGSILAVILQPALANLSDRTRFFGIIGMMGIQIGFMLLLAVGILLIDRHSLILSVIFIMGLAWLTIVQPLLNSLCFALERSGFDVNFGVARSMGSLAYAVLVALLGIAVQNHGVGVIPVWGVAILTAVLIILGFTGYHYKKACAMNGIDPVRVEVESKQRAAEITFEDFLRTHKMFILFSTGIIGLFFGNAIINNYLIQILQPIGGSSDDMGGILGVMAAMEIPTMVFFTGLRRRFSCQLMLKAAAIAYVFKIGLCYVATSVVMIYVAQCAQMLSFGLFLPAIVHFIDEVMDRGEAVRGQSVFTSMSTVGSVFASLTGGIMLDMVGARIMLLVTTIVTAIGAAIIIATVGRVGKKPGVQ